MTLISNLLQELEWMASVDESDSEGASGAAAHDAGFLRNVLDAFVVALQR